MQKEYNRQRPTIIEMMPQLREQLHNYACFRLGSSIDADDAVQETFMRFYMRIQDSAKAEITHPRNFLFKTLVNICHDWEKRHKLITSIPLEHCDVAEPSEENRNEEFQRIISLLELVPPEQAEVIRLRIYGNNSFAEIADILSVPLPTIKSRFLYGLKNLRKRMHKS